MAILVNERDKLLSTTVPRLVDPSESDPLVVTASSSLLKYVANPASPATLLPGEGITLYALTSRIGDVSWSIVGGPIAGVTLSASTGNTVNLTYTNALTVDSISVTASINNTNYSPASVQNTLNFTKQIPAKSIKNLTVYKRGTSSTPSGGSYVFSSNTLVPPSGWSVSIPAGTDPVYSSTTQVYTYKDDSAVAINTSGWSAPVLTVQNGSTGDSVDIIFTRSLTQPATPAASSSTPSGWYSDVNSVPSTPTGGGIWACTGAKVAPATTYTWGTPVKQSGSTVVELTVFKRNVGTPTAPLGGSYNFSTTTLTPPAGWSIGFPAGTDPVYTSRIAVSSSDPTATIAIAGTWSEPILTVQNGTNGTNGSDATVTINNIKSAIESGSSTTINLQNHSEFFKSSNSSTTGVFIGAGGLYGKKAGVTTFAISNTGDVEFVGNIKGGSNLDINGTATFNGRTEVSGFGNSTVTVNSPVGNSAGIYVYSNAAGIHALTSGVTPGAAAVAGLAPSTNNTVIGVRGAANAGIGVSGTSNNNVGVHGGLGSSVGFGVHAENAHTSGGTVGVGAGLCVTGGFKWGSVKWADPSSTGTKFLRDDGTWATPGGGASGVASFNSRTGAVTLTGNDVATALAGTGLTLQANISGTAASASYASSAGNASTLGGYDTTNYLRGTGLMVTGAKTLMGYVPVMGFGTNVFIAVYL